MSLRFCSKSFRTYFIIEFWTNFIQ
jgi:hypothetical protein